MYKSCPQEHHEETQVASWTDRQTSTLSLSLNDADNERAKGERGSGEEGGRDGGEHERKGGHGEKGVCVCEREREREREREIEYEGKDREKQIRDNNKES